MSTTTTTTKVRVLTALGVMTLILWTVFAILIVALLIMDFISGDTDHDSPTVVALTQIWLALGGGAFVMTVLLVFAAIAWMGRETLSMDPDEAG